VGEVGVNHRVGVLDDNCDVQLTVSTAVEVVNAIRK
jgi:hypothetical protein